jgi:hypothetical protein
MWKEAVALRGGTLLFAGDLDADQLSDQLPIFLVVRARARRWDFISVQDDWFGRSPIAALFLSGDCRTLAWTAAAEREPGQAGTSYHPAAPDEAPIIYRLALDDQLANAERADTGNLAGFAEARPATAPTSYRASRAPGAARTTHLLSLSEKTASPSRARTASYYSSI